MLSDTTLASHSLGNVRLRTGGIDLAGLGLTVPEILAALTSAKLPDHGDPFDVHEILRARTPQQVLERNVTRCFLRPDDPDPASETATLLEVRLDVACDEAGTVITGSLNTLLYDRSQSPWGDNEPSLAARALRRASEQKHAGRPKPWNVSSLQDEVRTEQLRRLGAFFFGAASWVARMVRSFLHLNMWWGVLCFGSLGCASPAMIEIDGDVVALVAPYGSTRRHLIV